MVQIRLTNTCTRKKEPFQPLDPRNVRLYLCGPTVYDRAHLGNARPVLVFDVLVRLLRHVYGADRVTYVRNFTDVDDKINARAAATGRTIREITDETIAWYHDDMDALGALRPDHEPRATEYIPQMIAMIGDLIARGNAYEAKGHVLFDVRSFPDYGRLSGRSVDDMIAGARVEVAPFKRDPMDFVLWKPSEPDQPGWDSPWGRGRPGWHIECSAMSEALLGPSFDIHGGGIDLQFPHHENEVAQSCCAHPEGTFANVWLHNEMLQVEGKKMSKSLGNFFTVRDLLDRGVPGEVIRFVMLSTHYRKPMDWTEAKAKEAAAILRRWRKLTVGVKPSYQLPPKVVDTLADDLNTAGAIALLHELEKEENAADLLAAAQIFGILTPELGSWFRKNPTVREMEANPELYPEEVERFTELAKRSTASVKALVNRINLINEPIRNLSEVVDRQLSMMNEPIRRFMAMMDEVGDEVLSSMDPEATFDFDNLLKAKKIGIVRIIEERKKAKAEKNYILADELRSLAAKDGFEIYDTKKGMRWRPMRENE